MTKVVLKPLADVLYMAWTVDVTIPGRTDNTGILGWPLSSSGTALLTSGKHRKLMSALEWPYDLLLNMCVTSVLHTLAWGMVALEDAGNKHFCSFLQ